MEGVAAPCQIARHRNTHAGLLRGEERIDQGAGVMSGGQREALAAHLYGYGQRETLASHMNLSDAR